MANRVESEDETEELRSAALQTATSVLQIRQRAEQEIRRTKEALEQRTRELAEALVIMRATLESTTDAILVTDEEGKVTDFNDKYLDMWKIPREVLEAGTAGDVRELASRNFADPQRFFARIAEIAATAQESFDVLELKDGRIFERYSKVLSVEGRSMGRVWSLPRRDAAPPLRNHFPPAGGHRRLVRRRDHRQGFKQYHHQLEFRGGAHLRIHRRRNDRHVDHAIDPAGSPSGGTGDPRPHSAWRTLRSFRNHSPRQRRTATQRLHNGISDQGFRWPCGRRVQGGSRHY